MKKEITSSNNLMKRFISMLAVTCLLQLGGNDLFGQESSQPAELVSAKALFDAQLAERVSGPMASGYTQLNERYLRALENEIAREKQAGHLDMVLALEGEKKLIARGEKLPPLDPSAPPVLVKLRKIHSQESGKIETVATANRAAILAPHLKRLETLERELTRTNRIPDALKVREYRSIFTTEPAGADAVPGTPKAAPSPRLFSGVDEVVAAIPKEILRRLKSSSGMSEAILEANAFLAENVANKQMRITAKPVVTLPIIGGGNKLRAQFPRDILGRNDGGIADAAFWCYFDQSSPATVEMIPVNEEVTIQGRIGRCDLSTAGNGITLSVDLQETVLDPPQ
jgi:hypothetical protein